MTEWKPVLSVFGYVLINLTLGTFYSIGNVFLYIASYMRENGNPDVTKEQAVWITSTFLLGQGTFMLLGAFLEKRFNSRVPCIFGCVLHTASTFSTIYAIKTNFLAVVLIYGLGSGLGCGSTYMSSLIASQRWYPHKKGFVTGVIVAGFGFGGLIFTYLQTLYLNPDNIKPNESRYYDKIVYERVPDLFFFMGLIFAIVQTIGCILAFPGPSPAKLDKTPGLSHEVTIISEDLLPTMNSVYSAFKYKIFYVIGAMMVLVAPGIVFVNSLGKTFGISYIDDDRFLATVVAVAAVANASGRLFWGFLMDHFPFSYCYTLKVVLFTILVSLFPFSFVLSSKITYFIWMLGLFFGFSGTFVLFPVFIGQVFGEKYHGTTYGILYICLALSSVATSLAIHLTISQSLSGTNPDDSLFTRILLCESVAALYIASLVIYILLTPVKRLEHAITVRMVQEAIKHKDSLAFRQDLFPTEVGSLADKTANMISNQNEKENSLGSIVKIRNAANSDKRLRTLGRPTR